MSAIVQRKTLANVKPRWAPRVFVPDEPPPQTVAVLGIICSPDQDSNLEPPAYRADDLQIELPRSSDTRGATNYCNLEFILKLSFKIILPLDFKLYAYVYMGRENSSHTDNRGVKPGPH